MKSINPALVICRCGMHAHITTCVGVRGIDFSSKEEGQSAITQSFLLRQISRKEADNLRVCLEDSALPERASEVSRGATLRAAVATAITFGSRLAIGLTIALS